MCLSKWSFMNVIKGPVNGSFHMRSTRVPTIVHCATRQSRSLTWCSRRVATQRLAMPNYFILCTYLIRKPFSYCKRWTIESNWHCACFIRNTWRRCTCRLEMLTYNESFSDMLSASYLRARATIQNYVTRLWPREETMEVSGLHWPCGSFCVDINFHLSLVHRRAFPFYRSQISQWIILNGYYFLSRRKSAQQWCHFRNNPI